MGNTPRPEQERWVWVDLEMTGLDPEHDVIVQIATVVTDGDLNELANLDIVVWQPDSVLERMGPFVRKMHTDNGLLERIRKSDTDLMRAEQKTLEMVSAHVGYRKGILAGNSVWQDRRFITRYMPSFEGYLFYRQIDVSSLKVLFSAWYADKGVAPKTPSSHTALEDIRQSIAELRWYRQHMKVG